MWCEKLENGKVRFIERYTDPLTDKQLKVSIVMDKNTAATRKQAQTTLNDKIDQKIGKLLAYTQKSEITLLQLVELYREHQSHAVAPSTYKRNYHAMNTIMGYLGENTIVSRLTAAYVKARFLEHGESNGTFNERLERFKAFIRWGYENDYIADIRYLDKIKPLNDREKKERLQDKYLESVELLTLLNAMSVDKWQLLTEFLALSGLRCGEAIALNMSDIDFDNHLIHVTKNYDVVNKLVGPPKTPCSIRDVFMQPELEALCHRIRKFTLAGRLKYGHRSKLFFCDVNGNYLDYYAYNKYLGSVSLRTLQRKVTAHVMRHTHVSLMAESGVPLEAITRRVGHESSDITKNIYLHITEKQKEKDNAEFAKFKIHG